MDVLLVGGSGFIGGHLTETLLKQDHRVTVFSRSPEDADLPREAETISGDATDSAAVEGAVEGHDALVNLVALSPLFEPPRGLSHKQVHVGATSACMQAAAQHKIDRFVQLSALGADPHGDTAYIRAKGRAEELVADGDVPYTTFRPSVVFGDGGEFIRFTKRLTPGPLKVLPDGGRTRFQPIWVGDLVEMIVVALGDEQYRNSTYEIGGPEVLSLREITKLAYAADGRDVTIVSVPMELTKIGLTAVDQLPFFPMGADQARALQRDNICTDNEVTAFGIDPKSMLTVREYLGIEKS